MFLARFSASPPASLLLARLALANGVRCCLWFYSRSFIAIRDWFNNIDYKFMTILQVLVFASRGTGLIAVYFLCFLIGGWLTLAMLAGLCFTLTPAGGAVDVPGGCVVDG